jgi:uncharacterized surface protein with fasciclin (FAS1) repeats
MDNKSNIVETAETHGKFTTFTKALKLTELSNELGKEGEFTIFAPTDAAFAKLAETTLSNLFLPQNVDKLKALLKYHIVSGKLMSTDMEKRSDNATLNGQNIKIDSTNGVRVNNVTVQTADIEASNGVIHIINNVLMPSKVAGATR